MTSRNYSFLATCDISLPVKVKVYIPPCSVTPASHLLCYSVGLQGTPPLPASTATGRAAPSNDDDFSVSDILDFENTASLPSRSLLCEASIVCGGESISLSEQTQFSRSSEFNGQCSHSWDQWLTFTVTYKDVPLSATLHVTLWDITLPLRREMVGSARMPLFHRAKRLLRQGPHRVRIVHADGGAERYDDKYDSDEEDDGVLMHVEHLRRRVQPRRGGDGDGDGGGKGEWLSELSRQHLDALTDEALRDCQLRDEVHLLLELPTFERDAVFASEPSAPAPEPTEDNEIVLLRDVALGAANPIDLLRLRLARDQRRANSQEAPTAAARRRLRRLVLSPPTRALSFDEQDLVWRYRAYLQRDPKAVCKFARCVDWEDRAEAQQAVALMQAWEPPSAADALELLSARFTHAGVRQFAVDRLRAECSNATTELLLYLPQLVQALRYEPQEALAESEQQKEVPKGARTRAESAAAAVRALPPLAQFLVERAVDDMEVGNFLHWYLVAEVGAGGNVPLFARTLKAFHGALAAADAGASRAAQAKAPKQSQTPPTSPIKKKRVSTGGDAEHHARAASSGGASSRSHGHRSASLPEVPATLPLSALGRQPCGRREMFRRQGHLVERLSDLVKAVRAVKGDRPKRQAKLRAMLTAPEWAHFAETPLPLCPTVSVCGVRAESALIFKSAMQPLGLEFVTVDGGAYHAIYKVGDDVRQDQFTLGMITLMDRILKRENLDLKLTPYRTLATRTSPNVDECEGFVERVMGANGLASVIKQYGGDLRAYLRDHQPDPESEATYGIQYEALDNYVKSLAGYSVISYILGIGDRHLDNLLLAEDGRLFHIDFGYILGRDPKPFQSAIKLCKEMIEGMGGQGSQHYRDFVTHCCTAYNILRNSAGLTLNLFALMVDSSIPDIAADGETCVLKVQEKLRPEISPEDADALFQLLISESANALMSALTETFHRLAQNLRS